MADGGPDDPDGLGGEGSKIGDTTVKGHDVSPEAQAAGFYAIAYDTPYGTVISYRGTDGDGDAWNDFELISTIAGIPEQATLAAQFYRTVKDANPNKPIILTAAG